MLKNRTLSPVVQVFLKCAHEIVRQPDGVADGGAKSDFFMQSLVG